MVVVVVVVMVVGVVMVEVIVVAGAVMVVVAVGVVGGGRCRAPCACRMAAVARRGTMAAALEGRSSEERGQMMTRHNGDSC